MKDKGFAIFTIHYLDHPQHGDTQILDGWSYFWGAIGGPIYVLAKGFRGPALIMVAITLGIIVTAILMMGLVVIVTNDAAMLFVALFGVVGMAFGAQGLAAVELVRRAYLRQGYREGYY